MIANQAQPAVAQKLSLEAAANSLASALIAAVQASADPFEIEMGSAGLEIVARAALPSGIPNRARMKIFSPKSGHTLVFFFKRSLVLIAATVTATVGLTCVRHRGAQEMSAWLDFLSSGFHPTSARKTSGARFPTKSGIASLARACRIHQSGKEKRTIRARPAFPSPTHRLPISPVPLFSLCRALRVRYLHAAILGPTLVSAVVGHGTVLP